MSFSILIFVLPHIYISGKKCYNWEGGLVGADRGLSSHRILPSHAQNFLEFWKRPADLAIIPQVNLQGRNKWRKRLWQLFKCKLHSAVLVCKNVHFLCYTRWLKNLKTKLLQRGKDHPWPAQLLLFNASPWSTWLANPCKTQASPSLWSYL